MKFKKRLFGPKKKVYCSTTNCKKNPPLNNTRCAKKSPFGQLLGLTQQNTVIGQTLFCDTKEGEAIFF